MISRFANRMVQILTGHNIAEMCSTVDVLEVAAEDHAADYRRELGKVLDINNKLRGEVGAHRSVLAKLGAMADRRRRGQMTRRGFDETVDAIVAKVPMPIAMMDTIASPVGLHPGGRTMQSEPITWADASDGAGDCLDDIPITLIAIPRGDLSHG